MMTDSVLIKIKQEEIDKEVDVETLEESYDEKTTRKTGSFSLRIKRPRFRYTPPPDNCRKYKKRRKNAQNKTQKNPASSPQSVLIPEITKIFLKPMSSLIDISSLSSDNEDPLSSCNNINSIQQNLKKNEYKFVDPNNNERCLKERQRRSELMLAFQNLRSNLPALVSNHQATKILILTETLNYCRLLAKTEIENLSILRQLNIHHNNLVIKLTKLKRDQ